MYGRKTEISVGLFMVLGLVCLVYLSVNLGGVSLFKSDTYTIEASFRSVEGLEPGASVEVAGVPVGKVAQIRLEENEARIFMEIKNTTQISDDTIASVRTKGIIGDKFIKLAPGWSEQYLADNDVIMDTESAISIEELINKYLFDQ